jgi:hypothetical protein
MSLAYANTNGTDSLKWRRFHTMPQSDSQRQCIVIDNIAYGKTVVVTPTDAPNWIALAKRKGMLLCVQHRVLLYGDVEGYVLISIPLGME